MRFWRQMVEARISSNERLGVSLKELVETRMWLRIVANKKYVKPEKLAALMSELEELVKIFHSSIQTARRNIEGK